MLKWPAMVSFSADTLTTIYIQCDANAASDSISSLCTSTDKESGFNLVQIALQVEYILPLPTRSDRQSIEMKNRLERLLEIESLIFFYQLIKKKNKVAKLTSGSIYYLRPAGEI